MCGIIGYTGKKNAAPILVEGLKKLEYRGYDSFGIATADGAISVIKKEGRISNHAGNAGTLKGTRGIGHTRWATHGIPNDKNAHPHTDCTNRIALVHNGIIENYAELKRELIKRGHVFRSDTDTEAIVHLVEEEYAKQHDLPEAVRAAVSRLKGSYALLVLASDEETIVAARMASPLVLGIGDAETFIASDITPMLEYTERVIFLDDGDIAAVTRDDVSIYHNCERVERPVELIDWSVEDGKKGGFAHYMVKEIYEQPQVFYNTIRGTDDASLPDYYRMKDPITIVACGSSYHAGMVFKYLLEECCQVPARLDYASEFRYYPSPASGLVIGITQSGETADTLVALRLAKAHNCHTLAITNVLGSTVTRLADTTFYMRAGPEISVAATKSFIAQLAVLMQIINKFCGNNHSDTLLDAHTAIEEVLLMDISETVALCENARSIFYVGRGPFYPVALEGALKMKEISYIHAEGYAAGELKHGPFALLSDKTPVIALCMPGETYDVMISNIKEMKARGSPVIAIGRNGDTNLPEICDVFIPLPGANIFTQILTATVVLQLIAYHTAETLGRDIDRPRNLAKSVTVE
ncbi:glutamine--fructose-6-phosphate transaminase (isomerizing) [Methanoregula sp.]|uniref:glutamine--fructose-6-phosphate transaminase (isomerizing) n=1 Tax=Methanoregula sp. TaxID=2052170 RepID=UPI002601AC75|nr:glutamine--fructose-6-phosphate transaminase (isomerizing) [Methanoregula sp.]MDD5142276.1 glutamine--fructose-6-phosphate transaminase (isomerizing) [Methanoregula sp.]